MLKLLKKILILAMILALPGFLYYLLTVKGKNRYQPLAVFGPKKLAKTGRVVNGKFIPDTIFHTLPDFTLYDQNGRQVSAKTFNDKIIVVNFFYKHCPSICNEINRNIDTLVSEYAKNDMIDFVSVTVDPQRDTVAALKRYAAGFKVQSPKWLFLTGDTSIIYPLARNGFLVNAVKAENGGFIYSDKIILVDKHKRIRGYYYGTLPDDVQKLDDEIKVLVAVEIRDKDSPIY